MVPSPSARLASGPVRLKTSLTLSLALLLGVASPVAGAAPRKSSSAASRKPGKKPTSTTKPGTTDTPTAETAPPPEEAPVALIPEPPPVQVPPPPAPTAKAPWAGRVVVFGVPKQPSAAEATLRLEGELHDALSGQPELLQWADPATLVPASAPEGLDEGDKLFNEGKDAYDNLDTEKAATKFSAAADYYRQHAAELKPEKLARTCIFLGSTLMLNGEAPKAQTAFTCAALAEPSVRPENGLFGQDVHDAFNTARAALLRQPKGTLNVDSVPAGAHVFVRGQYLGLTPLQGVELPPGPQQVVLTLQGHESFGVFKEVSSGQTAGVSATLEPLPALDSLRSLAAQVPKAPKFDSEPLPTKVATLSQKLNARYVVLAVVDSGSKGKSEGQLFAWDTRDKKSLTHLKLNPLDVHGRQVAAGQVNDFLTGKPVPGQGPIELPPVMKKPWFWAAVGGVAVATTAGILLATQQQPGRLGDRLGNFGAGW